MAPHDPVRRQDKGRGEGTLRSDRYGRLQRRPHQRYRREPRLRSDRRGNVLRPAARSEKQNQRHLDPALPGHRTVVTGRPLCYGGGHAMPCTERLTACQDTAAITLLFACTVNVFSPAVRPV